MPKSEVPFTKNDDDVMLSVKDLNYFYGNIHAVRGISIHVKKNEIVALIGSNGAGKSTTLRAISHLISGTCKGSIYFNGENIYLMPSQKIVERGLMQVLEGRHIFPQISVEENLITGAYTRKRIDINMELEYVYSLFPRLKERFRQMGGTLSGGEQQMLAIARTLMGKPKMLMLDEPSLGLAPIIVEDVFEIIQRIHQEGTPVLLVEQNSLAALNIADRAYVMENGLIAFEDASENLLDNPKVQEAYLGI